MRTADQPRQTASIGSSSVAGHAPWLLLSAAFRYPQLYGQRGLAERPTGGPFRFRAVQRRSWGSVACSLPSQVCSPRRAAFSRFRDAGPACRSICLFLSRPFSSGEFGRALLCILDARQTRRSSRMWPIAASGLRSLRGSDSSLATSRTMGRSCLGFCPLAGFQTRSLLIAMGTSRLQTRNPVVSTPRVIRWPLVRSSRTYPLVGLRRPSCADVCRNDLFRLHPLARNRASCRGLRRRRPFSVL